LKKDIELEKIFQKGFFPMEMSLKDTVEESKPDEPVSMEEKKEKKVSDSDSDSDLESKKPVRENKEDKNEYLKNYLFSVKFYTSYNEDDLENFLFYDENEISENHFSKKIMIYIHPEVLINCFDVISFNDFKDNEETLNVKLSNDTENIYTLENCLKIFTTREQLGIFNHKSR
jgi:hypothetical protein